MVYTCSSLHFAIVLNSSYGNINLKPKQVQPCLEAVYSGRHTVGGLPTEYRKLVIFHALTKSTIDRGVRRTPQYIPSFVVVPLLNSLMSDQIRRSTEGNVKAAILNVREAKNSDDLELNEMSETNSSWSKEAKYDTIFTHLEAV